MSKEYDLSHLYEFCTVRQLEILEAIEKHGSQRKAAKALGVDRRGLERTVARTPEDMICMSRAR